MLYHGLVEKTPEEVRELLERKKKEEVFFTPPSNASIALRLPNAVCMCVVRVGREEGA